MSAWRRWFAGENRGSRRPPQAVGHRAAIEAVIARHHRLRGDVRSLDRCLQLRERRLPVLGGGYGVDVVAFLGSGLEHRGSLPECGSNPIPSLNHAINGSVDFSAHGVVEMRELDPLPKNPSDLSMLL